MGKQRGFTVVSLVLLLAAVAFAYCAFTFGPAYWDNYGVKQILKEGANYAFHHRTDHEIRSFVDRKLHEKFDTGELDARGNQVTPIEYDIHDGLRVEFTDAPPSVDVWFSYSRHVPLPLVGGERVVAFDVHVDEDLTPIKW
jgi:hypothetical protein